MQNVQCNHGDQFFEQYQRNKILVSISCGSARNILARL